MHRLYIHPAVRHVTSLVSAAVYKRRSSITKAFYTTMSAAAGDNGGEPPKPVDACTCLEGQLLFDPNNVLLRRVFFLDPEKTKYISVGFYPARNYQPMVEIGSPKSTPIALTDQHVKTLSEHLPAQIDALWRGDFYNVMDGEFAMHSAPPSTPPFDHGQKESQIGVHQTKRLTLSCLHIPHGGESAP